MGPEIGELESRLAEYAGVKHAISCSSGTDALLLALMAYGVGPGDAVFTSPFTFIATAEVISLLGATPIFVDIDPRTFNLDPEHLQSAVDALQNGTNHYPLPEGSISTMPCAKGIIAVDLFGLPADYDAINRIAKQNGLFVIEDAAQSFGGKYMGRMAGSLGNIGCTSFFPAKPLGCYGDGGMCFTDDDELNDLIRSLYIHGQGSSKYENVRIGINGRLDTIQAAVLHAKFDIFSEEIDKRQEVAMEYRERFLSVKGEIIPPEIPEGYRSAWAQYSILTQNENHRAFIQKKLGDSGIPTAIYYQRPLHLQKAFKNLNYPVGAFPICEDYSRRIMSLPMHPYLSSVDQENMVGIIAG
jgi:dTDP-4-amino-4,6-dideoxygalactose transaminase